MSTDRTTLLGQLKDHLDHEVKCHRRLLDLAEAKQRNIVSGNMQAFSELLKKEQEPLTAMLNLRQLRERILREVADALGLSRDTLRLTQVIERLSGQIRDELRTRITELKTLCERLREVNDSTMVLIRQSLGFVRDILGVLVGEPPANSYDRRGTTASVRGQRGSLLNLAG